MASSGIKNRQQAGTALVMLLWMVAGLLLLVSGTVYLARTDVQLTSVQIDQAKAQAAATGVAHLFMRDMLSARQQAEDMPEIYTGQYEIEGMALRARAIPSTGFIDLNTAAPELLENLLHFAAGLSQDDARSLARQIDLWRGGSLLMEQDNIGTEGQHAPFTVVEDLLRVPGMTRQIYDRISRGLSVGSGASPGINPIVADPVVLQAVSRGDESLVDFMQELRQDGRPASASAVARLDSPYLILGSSSVYCLEIDVMISANRTFQQRIWVDTSSGGEVLPWRFTRVMPITMRPFAQADGRDGDNAY